MRAFLLTVWCVCVCCLVFWFALTRGLGSGRREREREAGEKREREVRVYEEVTGVSGEVYGLCGDPSGVVVSASMAP